MAANKDNRGSLDWIKSKAAEAQDKAEKRMAETPRQMFLPGMEELMRAMPNPVARSSLFAPIARGKKKMHAGTALTSRSDASLEYWGVQLNEQHADICLQLLYEAQQAMGRPVKINRRAFLREIGWGASGREYERFHRYMKELTVATLIIETKKRDGSTKYRIGHTEAFHIVQGFRYDGDEEAYTFILDPRWVTLFGNREYALLDWEKRLNIGAGHDLAKSIQRLVATSSDQVQRYAMDWLKERAQYSSPMRKFRVALESAMRELERLEIVARWNIGQSTKGNDQLTVWVVK